MFREKTIKVTVDKSHLFTLGEKMYRESIEFIRELVNNAYDADATEVLIMVDDDKIVVTDNGSGMDTRGLEQFFTIGSEEKKVRSISPRFGRKRIGQFGIGKFSALAIADVFSIQSTKRGQKYSVIFDRNMWKKSDHWELPIERTRLTPLDHEGTIFTLQKITKPVRVSEVEKYLKDSVPLRAKKFSVFVNKKRITPRTVMGRVVPVAIKTLYGSIDGEIIVALNGGDVDEPGVECRVKQVLIKREYFGLEKKYYHGIGRLTGSVNADFLPLISARTDFIIDRPEYQLFTQLLHKQCEQVLIDMKKQSDTKNLQKVTRELEQIMKQIRGALLHNPDFIPQGRAVTRLKSEARKKIPAASVSLAEERQKSQEEKDRAKESESKTGGSPADEDSGKKPREDEQKPEIDVKPVVMKRIRLQKLGISCGIVSLGQDGPEVMSQGNAVYVNQDHLLYKRFSKKRDLLQLHLLRLITQEVVLMKKVRVTAADAFSWQSTLLKDALIE